MTDEPFAAAPACLPVTRPGDKGPEGRQPAVGQGPDG